MFDLIAIVTRTLLGLAPGPRPPHHAVAIVAPLTGAPGAAVPVPAPANLALEALDHVQQFYTKNQQVTAQFRQSVTNDTFGSTKTSDGTVWIMKPGKMRWDYVEKKKTTVEVKKSFISNSTTLYVVEHDNMQVVKKNLQQDLMPVAVSFLYGKGDLKTDFNAEVDTSGKYGGKGEQVLKLTPKKPSAQYKNLVLVVSPTDHHVTQSIIIDSSNNINHFRFFTPDFDKPIKDAWFELDEKAMKAKGYRVIDADEQAAVGKGSGAGSATPAPKK